MISPANRAITGNPQAKMQAMLDEARQDWQLIL
jgi:hypothetical protein